MPTIPPPPPIQLMSISLDKKTVNDRNNNVNKVEINVCSWAIYEPDIQKSCYFARVCEFTTPKECVYMQVDPMLQIGPTCGLCALSMIFRGHPTADELLEQARKLHFTNNGEMFSAKWLLDLFKINIESTSINPKSIRSYIYDGQLNSDFIKEKLKNHAMLLIPYDADRNHYPCKVNGHKAHWALACGYLIDNDDEFYLFVRHGKTKNLGLFSLEAISVSNGNLDEFEQPAWHPNETFVLPDGGIQGTLGLKNKSIVIEGLPNVVVKVV